MAGLAESLKDLLAEIIPQAIENMKQMVIDFIKELTGLDLSTIEDFLTSFLTQTGLDILGLAALNPVTLLTNLIGALQGIDITNPGAILQAIAHALEGVPVIGDVITLLEHIVLGGGTGGDDGFPYTLPITFGGELAASPVVAWFKNVRNFLNFTDFASPSFDLADAWNNFTNGTNQLAGALSDLGAGVQGTVNGIVNSLLNLTGNYWTQAQADAALKAQAEALAAAAVALAQLQGNGNQNNTGGINKVVDFSTYPDSAGLPPIFTTTYLTGSVGAFGVQGGAARVTVSETWDTSRTFIAEYNVVSTVGDYQKVGGVWAGVPGSSYYNPTPFWVPTPWFGPYGAEHHIYCRYKDVNNWVRVRFTANGNGLTPTAYLECRVAGTTTVLDSVGHTFQPNTAYWLEAGTAGGLRTYRVMSGVKALITFTDSSSVTQVGAGFRGASFGGLMRGASAAGVPANPGPLIGFAVQDNAPAATVGSGFRAYRANTTTNVSHGAASEFANNLLDTVDMTTPEYTFIPGTNCRVQVSVTDWYMVEIKIRTQGTSNTVVRLHRGNASTPATLIRSGPSSNQMGAVQGTWIVYLKAGDWITGGTSDAVTITGAADGTGTAIAITRVGKATVAP
ncbi:hypothetical protein B5P44_15775 [Mycobacterium sp. CBMA 213]|nr:hypothetical protein [Mycolicibacterium sp. CBMA 213]